MSHILVVEDETIIRQVLCRLLTHHGHQVTDVDNLNDAKQQALDHFDLIITDLRLPGGLGTELITMATNTPVLIMTSYASMSSAVDAMKLGAADYIAKPFDHDELLRTVDTLLKQHTQPEDNDSFNELPADVRASSPIIGDCPAMQLLFKHIQKVAPTEATVLILGESGTGKELVAQEIHRQSARSNMPIVSVNCAAIPETLIESELFGHEKGAFTGAASQRIGLVEAADGGTLFLDEIGELPLEAQARLLRVLQEGEIRRVGSIHSHKVDVRLVAATHRNLRERAREGDFREDLYYRLNVIELKLPPLRDRADDKLTLANAILQRISEKVGKPNLKLHARTLEAINRYNWPGNVRELENAIERAVILSDSNVIMKDALGLHSNADDYLSDALKDNLLQPEVTQVATHTNVTNTTHANAHYPGDLSLDDYFVHFVLENEHHMNETELAKTLGISRKSLWERRNKLGIPRKKSTKSTKADNEED